MDNKIKTDYKSYEKRQLQKRHTSPQWRAYTEEEEEFINLHWEPIIRNKYSPKLNVFFTYFMGACCLLFAGVAIMVLFQYFIVGLMFGLISLGFGVLAKTGLTQHRNRKQDLFNITNGQYQVAKALACNLDVLQISGGTFNTEDKLSYVDILGEDGTLLVENVEIPFELGKALLERDINNFPCLLIKIDKKTDWLGLPKFK